MRLALIGYGSVGRAFARLLARKHSVYPFRIVAIHTARHGTAYDARGLALEPQFGPPASSIGEFLDRGQPDVAIEITTLAPRDGQPAMTHIRAAFDRHMHVITANKGPVAHGCHQLLAEARLAGVEFRFESTVMDGTPIFNNVRNNLPGAEIQGFTGVLNSTSNVVLRAMQRGLSVEEGLREAEALGITEADVSYDLDGWDSAAKAAVLANVLMQAHTTPNDVDRQGISSISTAEALEVARGGGTFALVARGERTGGTVRLQVRPEVLSAGDPLASATGTSNILLLHTDLMGTIGALSLNPGVEQTAYGLLADLVDIARSV